MCRYIRFYKSKGILSIGIIDRRRRGSRIVIFNGPGRYDSLGNINNIASRIIIILFINYAL